MKMTLVTRCLFLFMLLFCVKMANAEQETALSIIQKSDDIRSPNKPFRYKVTITEFKLNSEQPQNKQILDISMRFLKSQNGEEADARSLVRFIYPARDKGKMMLSNWYELWFYMPGLRRPVPISREQRLIGQISNGDVVVTNFEDAYDSTLLGEESCGDNLCYKLSLVRKTPEITYPSIIYLVEKSTYRPYMAAYYSLDNKLIKEVRYQDYQFLLGKERPSRIVITDVRHHNYYSIMEYSDLRYESLPLFHFTKEYLQRG